MENSIDTSVSRIAKESRIFMNAPSTILGSSGEDIIQIQPGLNQHEQSKKNG